jgi:hypothetical protein
MLLKIWVDIPYIMNLQKLSGQKDGSLECSFLALNALKLTFVISTFLTGLYSGPRKNERIRGSEREEGGTMKGEGEEMTEEER